MPSEARMRLDDAVFDLYGLDADQRALVKDMVSSTVEEWGVLLAFVVDGRFMAAMQFIAGYVTRDDQDHLLSGFEPVDWPPRRHLFETEHQRGGSNQCIRLLHLFLPFPRCL